MSSNNKEKYVGEICLKTTILPFLEEICGLLRIAFGPLGDAVMVHQKSPKEIKITKVNETILDLECFSKFWQQPIKNIELNLL